MIGRYAYAIYDEGALLDINVAGYPFNTTAAQAGGKGSLAFADLRVIGLPNDPSDDPKQIDRIVGWRNYATAKPSPVAVTGKIAKFKFDAAAATDYCNAVLSNTTGFLKVSGSVASDGQTDQAFLSRQELLEFRSSSGFSQEVLQYLGTFSRAVTAPSAFGAVRFSTGGTLRHYHDDGTFSKRSVAAGDPLLQSRFSLGKLAGVTSSGTLAMNQSCFGHQWNNDQIRWDYVGSTGNTLQSAIKTPGEIASEPAPREPNFFELLKAGIGGGSLGDYPQNPDFQIIQIGANIIEQSGSPATICFHCPPPASTGTDSVQTASGIANPSGSKGKPRSVGELGYVFRDAAFNTLDFSSTNSADAALLDLFSTLDEPPVIAGQINPNRASAAVLQAVLAGTTKDGTSSQTFSSSEAKTLATQLATQFGNSPLRTRADLVPALSSAPSLPAVRALAPVTNVRTWNLMVDLIAQTGVFPPNAQTLDQFVVQGERHYWLHVAIDRFTGAVVDQQLEPVYE